MSEVVLTISLPRALPSRRTLLGAVLSALAGAAVLAAVLALSAGAPRPHAAAGRRIAGPGAGFALTLPAGWVALPARSAAAVPSAPVAVLRRADHRGLVMVHAVGAVRGTVRSMARALTRDLARRLPGIVAVSARTVPIRGGSAFLYTFTRGSTVQSLAVATVEGRTYTLDSVSPGAARDAAAQIGSILASFGPAA